MKFNSNLKQQFVPWHWESWQPASPSGTPQSGRKKSYLKGPDCGTRTGKVLLAMTQSKPAFPPPRCTAFFTKKQWQRCGVSKSKEYLKISWSCQGWYFHLPSGSTPFSLNSIESPKENSGLIIETKNKKIKSVTKPTNEKYSRL